MEDEVGNF